MALGRSSRSRPAGAGRSRRRDGDPAAGLAQDVTSLRVGRWSVNERTLLIAGGVLAPVGVAVVIFGWVGAARTANVYEQIPYLISGGLLGLALVFLGGFLYFAHWMTQAVKEQRAGAAAVVDAVSRLAEAVERQGSAITALAAPFDGRAPRAGMSGGSTAASGPAPAGNGTDLVATGTGTMAHRPTCRVVAGRPGLRAVGAGEGLEPCRLCHPYD